MGIQINTQPQTFKTNSTVVGLNAGLSAVAGLTVYGSVSASGLLLGSVPLSGLQTTGATAQQVLTYNGSTGYWVASAAGGGSIGAPIKTTVTSTGAATYVINGYTNTTAENYLVYLDGVHQVPGSDYTITSTSGGSITFSPAPAVGVVADVLAFQSSIAAYSLSGIAPTLNTSVGTGSQLSFAINGFTNTTPQNYLVSVGGLIQRPGTDYTASAGNIVFTSAPPNGSQVLMIAWQTLPGTANNTTIQAQNNGGATSTVGTLNFNNGLSARVSGVTAEVRLPEATAGQVLTYNGSTSTWVASAAPQGTGVTSLSSKGYTTLGNGLIFQWGATNSTIAGNSTQAVTFAIPFPTACLNLSVTVSGAPTVNDNGLAAPQYASLTTSGFTAVNKDGDSSYFMSYFAVGY